VPVANGLGIAVALVNLLFTAGLVVFLRDLGATVPLPVIVALWLWLPLIGLAITVIAGAFATAAWLGGWWTRRERLGFAALVIAALSFSSFLNYWKLLGFHY
jgi:hypothetical protein